MSKNSPSDPNVSAADNHAPIHVEVRDSIDDQASEAICQHACNRERCEKFVARLRR